VTDLFKHLTAQEPLRVTRSELNNLTNNGAHQVRVHILVYSTDINRISGGSVADLAARVRAD